MSVSIRTTGVSDLGAILDLLSSSDLTADGLLNDAEVILVATDANGVAGCGAIEIDGSVGLLRSVAVSRERRGEGLGSAIVREIEREAHQRGITALYLLTTTAEVFFDKLGYSRQDRNLLPDVVKTSAEFGACSAAGATVMFRNL